MAKIIQQVQMPEVAHAELVARYEEVVARHEVFLAAFDAMDKKLRETDDIVLNRMPVDAAEGMLLMRQELQDRATTLQVLRTRLWKKIQAAKA